MERGGRNQEECFRHGTEARRNDITYREGAMQKKLLSFEQRFAPVDDTNCRLHSNAVVDDCKKLLEKLRLPSSNDRPDPRYAIIRVPLTRAASVYAFRSGSFLFY